MLAQTVVEGEVSGFAFVDEDASLWFLASTVGPLGQWKCLSTGGVQTELVDLYLDVEGDDANTGLSSEQAVATLERLNVIWSALGTQAAPVVVHAAEGSYVWREFDRRLQATSEARLHLVGDFEVLATGTLGAQTWMNKVLAPSTLVQGAHNGCTFEITSGALSGKKVLILKNDTTHWFMDADGASGNKAIAAGVTYRITRSKTIFTSDSEGLVTLFSGMGEAVTSRSVTLRNVAFEGTESTSWLISNSAVNMMGVEIRLGWLYLYDALVTAGIAGDVSLNTYVQPSDIQLLLTESGYVGAPATVDCWGIRAGYFEASGGTIFYGAMSNFDDPGYAYVAIYGNSQASFTGLYASWGGDSTGSQSRFQSFGSFYTDYYYMGAGYITCKVNRPVEIDTALGIGNNAYLTISVGATFKVWGTLEVTEGALAEIEGAGTFQLDGTGFGSIGVTIYANARFRLSCTNYAITSEDYGFSLDSGARAYLSVTPVGKVTAVGGDFALRGTTHAASELSAAGSSVTDGPSTSVERYVGA
jgi:hypothetical protein